MPKFPRENLGGILIPFTTPFAPDESVDARALAANVERWNETGVSGYVALGSTGERVHLSERECDLVVETARAHTPARLSFVVGVGQQSTRATIAEARRAAELGADAVLVITPHFYRNALTQDALAAHYVAVADASPVPVVLYNIPQNTGVALAPETVAALGEHENVAGIKDSSGEMVGFLEIVRRAPEDFSVLTGHAALLYASLASGASGAILAVACVAPRLVVSVYEAVAVGDHERASALQQRLSPLAAAVTTRFGIGGLKFALDAAGYAGGHVRAPLRAPGDDARREIARLLDEALVLTDESEAVSDARDKEASAGNARGAGN